MEKVFEKWKIETEYQKDLPMQELPDGSVIVFLNDETIINHVIGVLCRHDAGQERC